MSILPKIVKRPEVQVIHSENGYITLDFPFQLRDPGKVGALVLDVSKYNGRFDDTPAEVLALRESDVTAFLVASLLGRTTSSTLRINGSQATLEGAEIAGEETKHTLTRQIKAVCGGVLGGIVKTTVCVNNATPSVAAA